MTRSGQPFADSDWLQHYLMDAVRRNLCTKIYCTTCGAWEFRVGLRVKFTEAARHQNMPKLDYRTAIDIGRSLALVHPDEANYHSFERAVRMVIHEVWYAIGEKAAERDLVSILAGTWAGSILESMKVHHRARVAARRAHEQSQDPEFVRQKREEKRRLRQEKHAERLVLKKERDRIWHEKHGKGEP